MKLRYAGFKGEIPRAGRALLPPGFAQLAQNVKLWSGELRPFRAPRRVSELAKSGTKLSLHRFAAVAGGDAEGSITSVQNTSPVRIVSAGHNRTTGDRIFIGNTGLSIDNDTYVITVIDTNTYSLNGTTAAGAASSGYWTKQNGFWLHWTNDVDAAQGPIANDTEARTYITGDGVPKMTYAGIATAGGGETYPNNTYTLGIPAPAAAPTVTPGAGGGCDAADQITTAYVYTYVSALGEEGPPSPPSSSVTYCPGQTLSLSGLSTGPVGSYNIDRKRIYRVPNGLATYQFVSEIAVATATYDDSALDAELAEDIPTADPLYAMPPEDGHSIGFLANGVGYMVSGKDLYLCPPFQPHSWPLSYMLTADFTIIGAGSFDNSIVLCTAGVPYIVTVTDPGSASMTKLEDYKQACMAKRGIASLEGVGVVYPSPDGLVAVGPGGPSLLTKDYLTKDEWLALNPASISRALTHDGRYFAFFSSGGGFIFDPSENGAGFVRITTTCTGGFKDPLTDSLFLIIGGYVEKWEGDTTKLSMSWRSRLEQSPYPNSYAFLRVLADTYADTTIKVYADGVLKRTAAITSSVPVRLPGGFRADTWEILVEGRDNIRDILLAETSADLRVK